MWSPKSHMLAIRCGLLVLPRAPHARQTVSCVKERELLTQLCIPGTEQVSTEMAQVPPFSHADLPVAPSH